MRKELYKELVQQMPEQLRKELINTLTKAEDAGIFVRMNESVNLRIDGIYRRKMEKFLEVLKSVTLK